MAERGLFVTGTDTGVGKTRIASALVAATARAGRRVAVMKPVETGCAERDGELWPADAMALRQAAGGAGDPRRVCRYRFRPPVSPSVAAREAGVAIDLTKIREDAQALGHDADLLVVEGAGGLLVPLGGGLVMADVPRALELPVVIVARAALGTINHTLLTVAEARRRGLKVVGVVLNRLTAERGADDTTNAGEIEREGDVGVLGIFPFLPGERPATELAGAASRSLDLEWLLAGPAPGREGASVG